MSFRDGTRFNPRPTAHRWVVLLGVVWGSCCCQQEPPASAPLQISCGASTSSSSSASSGCGSSAAPLPNCDGGCALGLTCDQQTDSCVGTTCESPANCPAGWQCLSGLCSEPTCEPPCTSGTCIAGRCLFGADGGRSDGGSDAGAHAGSDAGMDAGVCESGMIDGFAAILADDPLGYWRLAEKSGSVAVDSSPGGPDGSYGTNVTLGVPGLWGYRGDVAASFPGGTFGSPKTVAIPQSDRLQPDAGLTIEAWFELEVLPANVPGQVPSLVHLGSNAGTPPYSLDLDPVASQIHFVLSTADGLRSISSATPLHQGSIFYIAATFDGATLSIFLNGAIDAEQTFPWTTLAGYDDMSGVTLAGNPDQTSRPAFGGLLEDVAIYGSALSAARIEAHNQAAASACVPGALRGGDGGVGDGGADAGSGDGGPDAGLDAGSPAWRVDGGADGGGDGGEDDAGPTDAGPPTDDGGPEDAGDLDGGAAIDAGPLGGGAVDAG